MRQRDVERWRKTDGGEGKRERNEGWPDGTLLSNFDSSWEESLRGTLFLIGASAFGYACVLTVSSCYIVNHSIANMDSLLVYITPCGCAPLRRSILR